VRAADVKDVTPPRETSGAVVRVVLSYVRERGGEEAVRAVLERARLSGEGAHDDSTWISYAARIRLYEATVDVLGEPDAMLQIGAASLRRSPNPAIVLLLRALGSPREVFAQLARALPKFTTTSTLRVLEVEDRRAYVDYRLHDGYEHSRLDCGYAEGLFGIVPTIFGLAPATVDHHRCQADGHPSCRYEIRWAPRPRAPWRRRRARRLALEGEVRALREQLASLQSAASDLVRSEDLESVLQRVADRAASAVLAQGYLLAVEDPYGGPPRVHSTGMSPDDAALLASRLLAGDDLGPNAVVVDVASARRRHGRLAAIDPAGHTGSVIERPLLGAYAGHAAAALDTIIALEGARKGEERANALLRLATSLVRTQRAAEVAQIIAEALPDIVGSSRGGVLLWDDAAGDLYAAAATGLSAGERQVLSGYRISPERSPTLAAIRDDPRPRLVTREAAEPFVRDMLERTGGDRVAVTPMVADGRLLGVVTSGWTGAEDSPEYADLIARLDGVASQAVAALLNAELVARVHHQSLHDALTELPNRELFASRAVLAGHGNVPVGLLFCDLDRFKKVNDTLGHAAGDELLRHVAVRLAGCVRDGDTVARLSGDEFAVLLPDVAGPAEVHHVADRIVEALARPFVVEGHELLVTASVGVAFDGTGTDGAESLLRDADGAMYQAKRRGRNQVARLSAPAAHPSASTLSLEADLDAALRQDALSVAFQPIVELESGEEVGREALVRWQHPTRGLLQPAAFVPLAESAGLVVALDLAVLRRAVRAAGAWHAAGAARSVAVNLSGPTLADPRLLGAVRDLLEETGLPSAALHLEVTENAVGEDVDAVEERLHQLKALGVRLSLDDFGTGQSSIGWLRRFPVDRVKIDRSFVADVETDRSSRALVHGIVALGSGLGLEILAEGIETEEQRRLVAAAGCRLGQGYLFGRPRLAWDDVQAQSRRRPDRYDPVSTRQ
jgi:diguanylate cyclase (GGDEF)-like protein